MPAMAVSPPTNGQLDGPTLRLLRVSKRITGSAVARHMGVTRQRVSAIETDSAPTSVAIERYLTALAKAERER